MSEPTIVREHAVQAAADIPDAGAHGGGGEPTTSGGGEAAAMAAETPASSTKRARTKAPKAEAAQSTVDANGAMQDDLAGPAEEIPDKLYFRIGEVARLAGIKPYVLRFWESEFSSLGPKKSGTGHRLYRRKDVQLVLEIKTLLYEKRFTIEGARKHLETRGKLEAAPAASARGVKGAAKKAPKAQVSLFDVPVSAIDSVRKELTEILKLLQA